MGRGDGRGLFVVPGVIAIMALSMIYAAFGKVGVVAALFFGLKAAVLAIVLEAVIRIGKRSLKNNVMRGLAVAAFIGIFFFEVPFPIIILGAGLIGFFGGRAGLPQFAVGGGHGPAQGRAVAPAEDLLGDVLADHTCPTVARALRASSIWLMLWLVPVVTVLWTLGEANVFSQIAIFFSKMAMVTFGGAYAVLAYVAQQAVEHYHWLRPGEMLDGLGMAETTPGPLIMVLQFVGFMAAFRDPGSLSPMAAGVLGGLLATWVTFIPCFLWIFLGRRSLRSCEATRRSRARSRPSPLRSSASCSISRSGLRSIPFSERSSRFGPTASASMPRCYPVSILRPSSYPLLPRLRSSGSRLA